MGDIMKNYASALLFFISCTSVAAFDIPVFYRAARFQGTPYPSAKPFQSLISVSYGEGATHRGHNVHGESVPYLSTAGSINVNTLASNIENLTSTNYPLTYTYLRSSAGTIPALNFSGNDGIIDLEGKFSLQEWNIAAHINLVKGFFIEGLLPLKSVNAPGLTIHNKTSSSNVGASTFQTFLDTNFNGVLQEHGYQPLSSAFKKTGLGDCAVFLGWRGFSNNAFGIVKDVTGELSLGGYLPTASKNHERYVQEIPFGYDEHWGVTGRGRAQAFVCDYCSLGAYALATVFFPALKTIRMKTDSSQSGIILFERGKAHVNKGALWQVGGYLGIHNFSRALSLFTGLSLVQQEHTNLQVEDDNFLNTYITTQNNNAAVIEKPSKNHITNSAQQLAYWNQGTLHLMLSYDTRQHCNFKVSPSINFFYDLPLFSTLCYKTSLLGGGGGISVAFDF